MIPSTVRWLSGAASAKARNNEKITASSVVFAVADESVYRSIRKGGLRLQGRRLTAEAYEEIRPDVGCGHCAGWGYIESKCDRENARCGWCAGRHPTKEHRCPVEGCGVGKGHRCGHTVAKCANCGGPHFAKAKACPKKKAARSEADWWRSPSPSGGSLLMQGSLRSHRSAPREKRARWRWKRWGTSQAQGRR